MSTSPAPTAVVSAASWFLPVLVCMLAAAVTARLALGSLVADDAYITFRYAERLASGHGFTYNDGARVLGTTTPLYTVLLASAAKAGLSLPATALAIATLADAATIALLAYMLRASAGVTTGWLAATMYAVWPVCLTYAVSGLETSLYTALVCSCLVAATARRPLFTGWLCGALALCRPDGVVAVVVALWLLWRASGARAAAQALSIAAVVGLPWVAFATVYFGSPVPQSVIAKAALGHAPLVGWRTFFDFFTGGKYLLLSCVSAAGWYRLVRQPGPARALGAWSALYAVAFATSGAFSHFPWYFNPLLPAYFAGLAAALVGVAESAVALVGARWTRWPARASLDRLIAFGCVIVLVVGVANVARHRQFLVQLSAGREALYARVARSLAAEDPRSVLAATEIGTLGYFYPGRVLDLVGLVSPEAVHAAPLPLLRASNARWLVTYDTHFPRETVASEGFQRQFAQVARIPVSDSRSLEIYQARATMGAPSPMDR